MSEEKVETWDGSVFLAGLDRTTCRSLRRNVLDSTFRVFEKGCYALPDGKIVTIPEGSRTANRRKLHASVTRHDFKRAPAIADLTAAGITTVPPEEIAPIRVENGDCIDIATKLKQFIGSDRHVAVLDMAARRSPGGGYLTGAGAQEENLCRRSNLWAHIDTPRFTINEYYPLPYNGGLYARDVLFVRGNEPEQGYNFLPEPLWFDVVVVAAPVRPDTKRAPDGTLTYRHDEDAEIMLNRIRSTLQISALNGATDIVLCALGCGAFRNPPVVVARLFRQALREYAGYFRNVVFAVYEDHNSRGEGNFLPFQRELDGYSVVDKSS